MSKSQIKQISVCSMNKDRKAIMEHIQLKGMVEIIDVTDKDASFDEVDIPKELEKFYNGIGVAQEAVIILDKYTESKANALGFLHGRVAISRNENDCFYSRVDDVLAAAHEILQKERDIAEARAEIVRIRTQLDSLEPWLKMPIPLTFSGTKKCSVFIGSIAGENELSDILEKLAKAAPSLEALHVELVYSDKRQTCFYIICNKRDASMADNALREIGFIKPASTSRQIPSHQKEQLEAKLCEAKSNIKELKRQLASYLNMRSDLLLLEDHLRIRADKYEAISKLYHSRHAFVLNGYILAELAPHLKEELEAAYTCAVNISTPSEDADIPVLLKNSRFSQPTESVIANFGLPGKGDIDPTGIMSFFYYLMFGLMFSDAGYGFILAAVCGVSLLKFKNMDDNWKRNLRLFFWCGVSTVFWGVVFSSYFGDVVDVVSKTFFGKEMSIPPLWFAPLEHPMRLLMFCLAIGIVHLTTGYVLNGITAAKNGNYIDIVYDTVFPILTLYPLLLILMSSEMFMGLAGFELSLPGWLSSICLYVSLASLVGVVLTGGRESKNWGKRILKGIYAAYNVIAGWISDILSYSRLLALGLATGVIASVMNQLGAMVGSSIVGIIVFVLVFLLGQALNFGINILGAYVHSNRLEFVEFFGKFYEGGGRQFTPLGINTKHYKIVEEEAHHG